MTGLTPRLAYRFEGEEAVTFFVAAAAAGASAAD
jgi:hypothetical protein